MEYPDVRKGTYPCYYLPHLVEGTEIKDLELGIVLKSTLFLLVSDYAALRAEGLGNSHWDTSKSELGYAGSNAFRVVDRTDDTTCVFLTSAAVEESVSTLSFRELLEYFEYFGPLDENLSPELTFPGQQDYLIKFGRVPDGHGWFTKASLSPRVWQWLLENQANPSFRQDFLDPYIRILELTKSAAGRGSGQLQVYGDEESPTFQFNVDAGDGRWLSGSKRKSFDFQLHDHNFDYSGDVISVFYAITKIVTLAQTTFS